MAGQADPDGDTDVNRVYLSRVHLLQPKICYRRFPKELWFYALYVCYFALLCGFVRSQGDAIKLLTLMVQIFFLMWSGYNLMRYERIMKTALMTLVISCSAISVMQLLGVATTQWYSMMSAREPQSWGRTRTIWPITYPWVWSR